MTKEESQEFELKLRNFRKQLRYLMKYSKYPKLEDLLNSTLFEIKKYLVEHGAVKMPK